MYFRCVFHVGACEFQEVYVVWPVWPWLRIPSNHPTAQRSNVCSPKPPKKHAVGEAEFSASVQINFFLESCGLHPDTLKMGTHQAAWVVIRQLLSWHYGKCEKQGVLERCSGIQVKLGIPNPQENTSTYKNTKDSKEHKILVAKSFATCPVPQKKSRRERRSAGLSTSSSSSCGCVAADVLKFATAKAAYMRQSWHGGRSSSVDMMRSLALKKVGTSSKLFSESLKTKATAAMYDACFPTGQLDLISLELIVNDSPALGCWNVTLCLFLCGDGSKLEPQHHHIANDIFSRMGVYFKSGRTPIAHGHGWTGRFPEPSRGHSWGGLPMFNTHPHDAWPILALYSWQQNPNKHYLMTTNPNTTLG